MQCLSTPEGMESAGRTQLAALASLLARSAYCAARLEAEVRPLDAPSRSTMLSSGASDGQVTLEAHHASARKILLAVQQQLDLLETGRDTSIEIQSEISQRLNTLSREVQTIEELLPYAASDKRKVWGRRVQQLKADQCAQSALARSSPCGHPPLKKHTGVVRATIWAQGESPLAARMPTRSCGSAPLPAQSRQFHCLWPSRMTLGGRAPRLPSTPLSSTTSSASLRSARRCCRGETTRALTRTPSRSMPCRRRVSR